MVFIYWTNYNIPHNGRNLKLTMLYLKNFFLFETKIWSELFLWHFRFEPNFTGEANFCGDLKQNQNIFDLKQIFPCYLTQNPLSEGKSIIWSEIHYLKQIFCMTWSNIRYLKRNQISEIKYPCDPSNSFIRFEANSASWSKFFDFKRLFVVFSVSKH